MKNPHTDYYPQPRREFLSNPKNINNCDKSNAEISKTINTQIPANLCGIFSNYSGISENSSSFFESGSRLPRIYFFIYAFKVKHTAEDFVKLHNYLKFKQVIIYIFEYDERIKKLLKMD